MILALYKMKGLREHQISKLRNYWAHDHCCRNEHNSRDPPPKSKLHNWNTVLNYYRIIVTESPETYFPTILAPLKHISLQ